MSYIFIGGDVVPCDAISSCFQSEETLKSFLEGDLWSLIQKADHKIVNLETPICDTLSPINKDGVAFAAPSTVASGLSALSPLLCALANNHIMDQDTQGLNATIATLQKYNIKYTGAGTNVEAAMQPYFFEIEKKRIAVLGCAEHEFSVATSTKAGAYAFDALETPDYIKTIKNSCDFLIVLYHGGKEYFRYPSPELQKRCRKMVDCGADAVICQHSHCIGCKEEYNGAEILYGQGNFMFVNGNKVSNTFFKTALVIKLSIINNKLNFEYLPIVRRSTSVALAEEDEKTQILLDFQTRSEEIKVEGFVENNFCNYASAHASRLILRLSRFGYLFSAIDNRIFGGKLLKKLYKVRLGKHHRLALINYLQCEAHNELLRAFLNNR